MAPNEDPLSFNPPHLIADEPASADVWSPTSFLLSCDLSESLNLLPPCPVNDLPDHILTLIGNAHRLMQCQKMQSFFSTCILVQQSLVSFKTKSHQGLENLSKRNHIAILLRDIAV